METPTIVEIKLNTQIIPSHMTSILDQQKQTPEIMKRILKDEFCFWNMLRGSLLLAFEKIIAFVC